MVFWGGLSGTKRGKKRKLPWKPKSPTSRKRREKWGTPTDSGFRRLANLRFVRRQIAGMLYFVQIDSCRGEFGDLGPGAGSDFDIENFRSEHAADGAFVHGQEVAADPVPAFVIVVAVDADHHFHFWLSPEAGIVGTSEARAGIEVGIFVLAVGAD